MKVKLNNKTIIAYLWNTYVLCKASFFTDSGAYFEYNATDIIDYTGVYTLKFIPEEQRVEYKLYETGRMVSYKSSPFVPKSSELIEINKLPDRDVELYYYLNIKR